MFVSRATIKLSRGVSCAFSEIPGEIGIAFRNSLTGEQAFVTSLQKIIWTLKWIFVLQGISFQIAKNWIFLIWNWKTQWVKWAGWEQPTWWMNSVNKSHSSWMLFLSRMAYTVWFNENFISRFLSWFQKQNIFAFCIPVMQPHSADEHNPPIWMRNGYS